MSVTKLNVLIDKLANDARNALEAAVNLCMQHGHYNVELEHWLLCLLQDETSSCYQLLQSLSMDNTKIRIDIKQRLWNLQAGNDQTPVLSNRIIDLISQAWLIASLQYQQNIIHSAIILLALAQDTVLKQIVDTISFDLQQLDAAQVEAQFKKWQREQGEVVTIEQNKTNPIQATSALEQFAINLNAQVKFGRIDQAIGRELEISQVIDILARRRQNNALLTGEPGVGKTALVEGLACKIVAEDVPDALKSMQIYALDLGLLQAGASVKGEYERRLKALIQEIKSTPEPIILFIDEAHTLIGSGAASGQTDAANLLKPALARGELRCIAATTWSEYKQYFEKDAALVRRFQIVKVQEPSIENARAMLRSLCAQLEAYHGVRILEEAIQAAVVLSARYIHERQLPDKAISVLDTACARVAFTQSAKPKKLQCLQKQLEQWQLEAERLAIEKNQGVEHTTELRIIQQKIQQVNTELYDISEHWQQQQQLVAALNNEIAKLSTVKSKQAIFKKIKKIKRTLRQQPQPAWINDAVDKQAIANVIADWMGTPVGNMLATEANQLLHLVAMLQQKIIGQANAIEQISEMLTTSLAKLSDPNKPMGVFLLVGPSGVGKTETACILAEKLFGSQDKMTVINMSEFKEPHKVSMLVGSPPGYVGYGEGGVLTEAVRRKPYSIILLDEMEKAHPSVQDVFYQVFDKGIIKDGQGRDVSFKNCLIIMTTNAASELISQLYQTKKPPGYHKLLTLIQPELRKTFKPAFLGRVNVLPYLPLTQQDLTDILHLKLLQIKERLQTAHQLSLQIDMSFIKYVLNQCQNDDVGARQIDTVISNKLLPALSHIVLTQVIDKKALSKIIVKVNNSGDITCQTTLKHTSKSGRVAA